LDGDMGFLINMEERCAQFIVHVHSSFSSRNNVS
jgi:hypothetical protein